ncbi:hypothetical protein HG537_0G00700 [Torulaspora globosa]|uniref:Signal recognition particle SEC65 subunit n=1 Tax=Torulaspora globosa TaxID=48254 RepID=A0A7H9HYZ2_9SACH|nr:hypothetical protein HG537_0G00700 [Torulaspora sp. CBS 2947]
MPRIEEVEEYDDIDNLEMDLAELDPSLRTPIAPKVAPKVVRSQDSTGQVSFINPETGKVEGSSQISREELEEVKGFQVLYPCYFDKRRSHREGRRVPVELAVENPLAKTVADAVRSLGLLCIFEGEKTHPQDFGNPGRVRVLLKEHGRLVPSAAAYSGGKRQLMVEIAKYMATHPTTPESLREIPYGPEFDGIEFRRVPMVKGFKMNDIVPLHSPFLIGHPMTKSIYETTKPAPAAPEKQFKAIKNKFKVIRR